MLNGVTGPDWMNQDGFKFFVKVSELFKHSSKIKVRGDIMTMSNNYTLNDLDYDKIITQIKEQLDDTIIETNDDEYPQTVDDPIVKLEEIETVKNPSLLLYLWTEEN